MHLQRKNLAVDILGVNLKILADLFTANPPLYLII